MLVNKNDFRVNIPLWNIALWCILIVWTYGVTHAADLLFSNFEGFFMMVDNELTIKWHTPGMLSLIVGSILLAIFFLTYYIKLKNYNSKNPHNKVPAITFLRPGELLEDDEMLRQVTKNATKKVYILYSLTVPLLIFIMIIFPLDRYVYIVLLSLLLIVHNALYYREIRKFISGDYSLSNTSKPMFNKLQRGFIGFVVVAFILVITIPTIRIVQMEIEHKESLQEFKACVHEGKTATLELKENGSTTVICE